MTKTFERKVDISNAQIQVPVDVQSSYIQVPVDIQGQAIDLVMVPKYVEDSKSVTGIDAETDVLDLDVRLYKHLGLELKNTGNNDLVYRIVGYRKYDGSLAREIVSSTTLGAGAQDYKELDVSKYARIIVKVAAATSGNPSDIQVEYILKA